MSAVSDAIKHLRSTGSLEEAVAIALGKKALTEFNHVQTQAWFCPNENAVNQLVLLVQNKLGIAVSSIKDFSNGSQGGYEVVFSGDMGDSDIASLCSRLGCYPLSGASVPGSLS